MRRGYMLMVSNVYIYIGLVVAYSGRYSDHMSRVSGRLRYSDHMSRVYG